ncbi:MAG TPA: penicillin acylase family protein, partial [Burkholderiales bacterium]|nr:penicillin acylase family protein [Burkholderiales bacterium]
MARLALLLIVTIAAAALGGYAFLRQSLPDIEGNIPTPGLAASVEVLRDGFGVPHLFAGSERDAHFALGFAHAQDRLWQMEMNRRVAAGRLAEVLGERALDTDRFMRTLGLRRAAEANLEHLEAETRTHLEAYAAGVNAFLAARRVLPPEFWLLRVRPEPWTPADSLSLIKLMALDLDGNWRSELLRLGLARRLPMARVHEFLPPYPGEAPVPLPELAWNQRLRPDPVVPFFDALLAGGSGGASNSWVVARGAGGAPLLANDPHLGLTAPSVWYLAHLEAPGLSAIGATLPGL